MFKNLCTFRKNATELLSILFYFILMVMFLPNFLESMCRVQTERHSPKDCILTSQVPQIIGIKSGFLHQMSQMKYIRTRSTNLQDNKKFMLSNLKLQSIPNAAINCVNYILMNIHVSGRNMKIRCLKMCSETDVH